MNLHFPSVFFYYSGYYREIEYSLDFLPRNDDGPDLRWCLGQIFRLQTESITGEKFLFSEIVVEL